MTDNTGPTIDYAALLERPVQTRHDAALLLAVSVPHIDGAIRRGELKARRLGRRVLIPTAELLRWAGLTEGGDVA